MLMFTFPKNKTKLFCYGNSFSKKGTKSFCYGNPNSQKENIIVLLWESQFPKREQNRSVQWESHSKNRTIMFLFLQIWIPITKRFCFVFGKCKH